MEVTTAKVSGGLFRKRPCRGMLAACSRILKCVVLRFASAEGAILMVGFVIPRCDERPMKCRSGS